MKIGFVSVIANQTLSYDWARIVLPLFRDHFPDEFLAVVDHNCGQHEILDLANVVLHTSDTENLGHGKGMQTGYEWLRDNGYDIMVHIEQDCIYSDRIWRDNIVGAIEGGAWVAGLAQHPWGLQISASAWDIAQVKHSFCICPKGDDVLTEAHQRVINEKKIAESLISYGSPVEHYRFQLYKWDAGLKNWFHCAAENRAVVVETPNFRHVWGSWFRLPHEIPESEVFFHELRKKYLGQ
jgi:hypothetical protein